MSQVRVGKDVVVYPSNGGDWVSAHSGGMSTFSTPGPGKHWWELPAGFDCPDELVIINDHGNHFSWEPALDMPLVDYVRLLQSIEAAFSKIS
jgi:hypothetical protein